MTSRDAVAPPAHGAGRVEQLLREGRPPVFHVFQEIYRRAVAAPAGDEARPCDVPVVNGAPG